MPTFGKKWCDCFFCNIPHDSKSFHCDVYRWNYAITSVLEVDVKPRLHMWSWAHIQQHRKLVKHYRELYKIKITSKKPSEELLKELQVGWQLRVKSCVSRFSPTFIQPRDIPILKISYTVKTGALVCICRQMYLLCVIFGPVKHKATCTYQVCCINSDTQIRLIWH